MYSKTRHNYFGHFQNSPKPAKPVYVEFSCVAKSRQNPSKPVKTRHVLCVCFQISPFPAKTRHFGFPLGSLWKSAPRLQNRSWGSIPGFSSGRPQGPLAGGFGGRGTLQLTQKELNDHVGFFVEGSGAEGFAMQEAAQEEALQVMKNLFAKESAAAKAEGVEKKRAAMSPALRMANVEFVERLDNGLRKGLGFGLAKFVPARRLGALLAGERRDTANVGGAGQRRLCIEGPQGERRIESPHILVDGVRRHLVLHLFCDLGSIGWPGSSWLIHKVGLRGTLIYDVLHRRSCDWDGVVAEAGLRLVQFECTQILKFRHGPFHQSADHSALLRASEEVYRLTDQDNNLMYNILYPTIASELGLVDGSRASPEHLKEVWLAMKAVLCKPCKGSNTKTSRWFDFENSRGFLPHRAATLCVLIWIGTRRGWWKGFAQSPLNSFGIGDCPEQGDNIAPEGLEALEEPTEAAEGDDEHGDQEGPMRRISAATARSTAAKRRAACEYLAFLLQDARQRDEHEALASHGVSSRSICGTVRAVDAGLEDPRWDFGVVPRFGERVGCRMPQAGLQVVVRHGVRLQVGFPARGPKPGSDQGG